jgi:ribosomal-protein-alanine N-acetyltransferase
MDDVKGVIAINWAALPEHYSDSFFEELLRSSPETFLVAESDGRLVGYAMSRVEFGLSLTKRFGVSRRGHIVSIAVLEDHRRRGLGTALIEETLKGMSQRGCSEAYLEVRISNNEAVQMYKKLNFVVSTQLQAYYKDMEDAYQMVASLNA